MFKATDFQAGSTRKPAAICCLIIAVLLFTLTGCDRLLSALLPTEESSVPETQAYTLTERQRGILAENGLPTSYEELSLMQKSAIAAIEDMLCYLEQQYEDRFTYAGYVADSPVEQEHLLALSEAYPNCGPVTVYRSYADGAFSYRDNYSTLAAKLLYEQALNDWIAQSIPDSEFIVFSDVSSADASLQKDGILSQASAASYVLIAEDACTEEELKALVDAFGPWIREQSRKTQANVTLFYLAAPELMALADNDTYEDLLPRLREGVYYSCSVSVDGNLKIK